MNGVGFHLLQTEAFKMNILSLTHGGVARLSGTWHCIQNVCLLLHGNKLSYLLTLLMDKS